MSAMASSKHAPHKPKQAKRASKPVIVDEVFIRHRIERLIELVEKEHITKRDVLKAVASHPLLTLMIAFIPLLIFGLTFYNDSLLRHKRELFEQQTFYQDNISALSKAIVARNERAVLLRSALIGNLGTCETEGLDPEYRAICKQQLQELIYERKKDYDNAYLTWNANYAEHLFNIGRLFQNQPDVSYQHAFDDLKRLIVLFNSGALKTMDTCLTDLYARYQRNGVLPAVSPNPSCIGFDAAKARVRECSIVFAEQLHHIVTHTFATNPLVVQDLPSEAAAGVSSPSTAPNAKSAEKDLLKPIRELCDFPQSSMPQTSLQP